jgi:hypothetical protein
MAALDQDARQFRGLIGGDASADSQRDPHRDDA